MFEQSMVVTSPETRRRKRVAALLSVAAETIAVGAALCLPLFTGQALPPVEPPPQALTYHVDRSDAMQVFNGDNARQSGDTDDSDTAFRQPINIPDHVSTDPDRPRPIGHRCSDCEPAPPGWIPDEGGSSDGNRIARLLDHPDVVPVQQTTIYHPPTSKVMESLLVDRVDPIYPPIARTIRVQGMVVLQAMISRTGKIEGLEILSGHPILAKAAAEAVMQWRYRPYVLNGQPVEVRTEITVNFVLGR